MFRPRRETLRYRAFKLSVKYLTGEKKERFVTIMTSKTGPLSVKKWSKVNSSSSGQSWLKNVAFVYNLQLPSIAR